MPDYTMRAIIVIDVADKAAANVLAKQSYDTLGGMDTFSVALEPAGGGATAAYWAALSIGNGDLDFVQLLADGLPKSEVWIWVDQPRGVMQDLQDRFGGGNTYKDPNRETRTHARVRISASRADTSVVLNQLGCEVPSDAE